MARVPFLLQAFHHAVAGVYLAHASCEATIAATQFTEFECRDLVTGTAKTIRTARCHTDGCGSFIFFGLTIGV